MKLRHATPILLAPLLLLASACGSDSGLKRTISVSGSATVRTLPDLVEFDFGVSRTAATAKAALAANSKAMRRLIGALEAAGVAPRDLQTQQVSVYPQTNADGATTGFSASNSVHAKLREISKSDSVLEQAVAAGGNTISGPSFSKANTDLLTEQALAKAYEQARRKAESFAKRVDLGLGKPISIQESGEPGVVFGASPAREAAKGSVPIEPGRTEVSASLTVTFELS
jgi:uncharacterized protein YggE